jgi:hypothetical protein
MQRYLFADDVVTIPGARGTALDGEYHCHHGGMSVTLRVVTIEPGRELTLYSDQPVPLHTTTRLTDLGGGRTEIARAFLWEEPPNPEIADGVRQMMAAMVGAGEAALKEVYEERARGAAVAQGSQ